MRMHITPIFTLFLTTLAMMTMGPSASAFTPRGSSGLDIAALLSLRDQSVDWSHALQPSCEDKEVRHGERASDAKNTGSDDARAKLCVGPQALDNVRTIVLDPGHGGSNEGASGVAHVLEKQLTLELAYALRDALRQAYPGVRVLLTRYWDQDMKLYERVHFANLHQADLFISLHYNAAVHDRAVGVETYFLAVEQASPEMVMPTGHPVAAAQIPSTGMPVTGIPPKDKRPKLGTHNDALATLQRDLRRQHQHRESGQLAEAVQTQLIQHLDTMDRGVKQADFAVLRGALMPAVVVESGFLTHPKEGKAVLKRQHRNRLVSALVKAVRDFDRASNASQAHAQTPDKPQQTSGTFASN